MFCKHCGKELDERAVVCPNCGCATDNGTMGTGKAANDASSVGFGILGFLFPVVGLILYLVWKDQFPQRAKSAGKGALTGVIVEVVLTVLIWVLFMFFFFMLGISVY